MIEFLNVDKSFGKTKVLSGISMKINEGELVAVIGESGCGKTTLLKMVNNLIRPTSGSVIVDGEDIGKKGMNIVKLRRSIGYVVQSMGLFPHMTVKQNIELIPKLEKKNKEENLCEQTKSIMDLVGLAPETYSNRYPLELSGGQQQRVGVARAFALDPKIILMDEPFSALDPITRSDLQDELVNIQKKYKKTIFFVTHDMDEAVKIADKICVMNNGKILQYDTPENILKNPADEYVANFIGKKRIWSTPDLISVEDIKISNPEITGKGIKIFNALEKMKQTKVDSLIVIEKRNEYIGVVKAKSIRIVEDKSKLIDEYIDANVPTISSNCNLLQALEIFQKNNKTSIIPVVDKGKLTGLLTRSSIVTVLSDQYIEINRDKIEKWDINYFSNDDGEGRA